MKYGYREVRKMSMSALREFCIARELYTCGDCEEYDELLKMTRKEHITTDDIVEIAENILEHSNMNLSEFNNLCDALISITYSYIEEI